MLHHHNDGNILFNTTSKRKLDYYTIDKTSSTSVDNKLVKYQTASGVILSIELKEPYLVLYERVLFIQERSRLKEPYKQPTCYRLKSSNRRNINLEGYQRLYLRHVFIHLNSLNNVKIE